MSYHCGFVVAFSQDSNERTFFFEVRLTVTRAVTRQHFPMRRMPSIKYRISNSFDESSNKASVATPKFCLRTKQKCS